MWTCDKCGKPVKPTNDAINFDYLFQLGHLPGPLSKCFSGGARHLLPVDDCEGSPSRAQYFEGQPRDSRFPYDSERESKMREAYSKLKEAV